MIVTIVAYKHYQRILSLCPPLTPLCSGACHCLAVCPGLDCWGNRACAIARLALVNERGEHVIMASEETPSGETPARPHPLQGIMRPSWVLFQLIIVVLVPAALTLRTVHVAVGQPPVADNPTPLGYTWSLLLFIIPLLYLALWFLLHPQYQIQKKIFAITLAVLVPLGIVLDLLFAHTFFVFENHGAVLGFEVPGVGGGIPIEEFVFYISGFVFVLLLYIWSDEVWMDRYNPSYHTDTFQAHQRLLRFHWESVLAALILLGVAVVYKKVFAANPEGFPWYWTYLLAAAFVPSAGFFHSVRQHVNWRAFSFTFLQVTLISLMWEASLASPYQWWGYQPTAMMGIFLTAWSQLPVEAVFVWLAVTYTTVIIYEVITIWQVSGKRLGALLFGE